MRKLVIITGHSRGLGKYLFEQFEFHGHCVAGIARTAENSEGSQTLSWRGDINHSLKPFFDAVETRWRDVGEVVLINNAAVNHLTWLKDLRQDKLHEALMTNIEAQYGAVYEFMRRFNSVIPGGKRIIQIASIAGKVPMRCSSVYNTTKAAQIMFGEQLARELAPNTPVFVVCPGRLEHSMYGVDEAIETLRGWTKEQAEKYEAQYIPLGRRIKLSEVYDLVDFLANKATGAMTGSVINITGGQR